MEISAILTTATSDGYDPAELRAKKNAKSLPPAPNVWSDVLGLSPFERTAQALRDFGIKTAAVIPENRAVTQVLPTRPPFANDFTAAWEKAVASCVNQGTEHLLLLRTNTYSDLDFGELLQFHQERGSALTQAYASDGPLDIAVVNTKFIRDSGGEYRKSLSALIPNHERFIYGGYLNRLRRPQDFYRLMNDALYCRCNLRPVGRQVAEGVWLGEGAEVDSSSSLTAPCFIGAGTRLTCCTVAGGSAIERDCEIDCGTAIEGSWILQGTYIGVGLTVRHSLVRNQKMFNLDRRTEVSILDRRLIGGARGLSFGTGAGRVINTA